jgi:hypothetical protein
MAFRIKTNDTSPKLAVTLEDANGSAINISGAGGVRFHMKAFGATSLKVDAPMTITNATGGVVEYSWVAVDTNTAGTYYGEVEVTYADNTVETFPNNGYFTIIIKEDLD